jgi:raffinose/stachyose/melibiose transport system substrate-binding protein
LIKTRKLLCILSSITLALALTACGGSAQAGKAAAPKIVIFQSKVEIIDQLEAAAKAYTQETGVEVETRGTTGDDYFQQLKTGLANNQGPTIYSVGPGAEVEQLANYLADLSDLPFISKIGKGMAAEVNGKTVGIPYTVEGFGLVYNKSLINPADVKDYDSFVKMLQDQKSAGLNGFGLSQESYFLIGHILNHPFAVMPDYVDYMGKLAKGEVKMAETKEFQEFAKFYSAIREYSYNPLEVNYDKECGDFATGKTASIHQGNWAYGMFADYDLNFEMGLMPFPIAGNDKLAVSVPTVWGVNSQAPEADIKAAKDFLTWLYTSETGQKYIVEEFGFIPVVEGTSSESLDPLSAEVSRYVIEGKTLPWATNLYPAGIVDIHLVPVAEKFFSSAMTEEELLAALDEAWANAVK